MSDTVIKLENVSKRYRLGYVGADTLRDDIKIWWAKFRGRPHPLLPVEQSARVTGAKEDFIWALWEINLEVNRGEILGIIGANGAGKSTLLKILSRVTGPTTGVVKSKGSIGSLLEVGTGFHPELTGRENVYLNGAILGMTTKEIDRKFDEIVDFSGVENYIDTPVKRYSSGMRVRLGFSVAAHLDPEVLIVDEVLSVGDAVFRKKSAAKMQALSQSGGTILFVSHNMRSIQRICDRVVWLEKGRIKDTGEAATIVRTYLTDGPTVFVQNDIQQRISKLPDDPTFQLQNIRITQNGQEVSSYLNSEPIEIDILYYLKENTTGFRIYLDLLDQNDNILFRSYHDEFAEEIPSLSSGDYVSHTVIPSNLLAPITYELKVGATIFNLRSCLPPEGIRIRLPISSDSKANLAYVGDPIRGKLMPELNWKVDQLN